MASSRPVTMTISRTWPEISIVVTYLLAGYVAEAESMTLTTMKVMAKMRMRNLRRHLLTSLSRSISWMQKRRPSARLRKRLKKSPVGAIALTLKKRT